MSSSRRTNLNRIMQIEKEIKNISTDKEYQQLLRNMKIMDPMTVGSRNVAVGSPDDMDKIITVRRRSQEAKEVAESYELKLQKFSSRIQELRNEKVSLEKQLFR
jgi:predicted  nucleic acid-binding Zn-ribbon protein